MRELLMSCVTLALHMAMRDVKNIAITTPNSGIDHTVSQLLFATTYN